MKKEESPKIRVVKIEKDPKNLELFSKLAVKVSRFLLEEDLTNDQVLAFLNFLEYVTLKQFGAPDDLEEFLKLSKIHYWP